jgi:hypothetical protein
VLRLYNEHELSDEMHLYRKIPDVEVIISTLNNMCGVEATKIILNYVEQNYKLTSDHIPDKIEDFYKGLDSIFGKKASTTIKRVIHEKLMDRIFVRG